MVNSVCICVCLCVRAARVELASLHSCQRVLKLLNNLTTGIIFLTFIVNVIKSAFGTQRSCFLQWLLQRFIL